MRRPHVPIGMVIERNEVEGLCRQLPEKRRSQMMKVSRAVDHEWRKAAEDVANESLHGGTRRKAAQARTPLPRVAAWEAEGGGVERAIEVEVNCQAPQGTRR